MAEIQETGAEAAGPALNGKTAGRDKLEQLKANAFPPDTKPQRVARALEALKQAKRISTLDTATLKYIAQRADLEGN